MICYDNELIKIEAPLVVLPSFYVFYVESFKHGTVF